MVSKNWGISPHIFYCPLPYYIAQSKKILIASFRKSHSLKKTQTLQEYDFVHFFFNGYYFYNVQTIASSRFPIHLCDTKVSRPEGPLVFIVVAFSYLYIKI